MNLFWILLKILLEILLEIIFQSHFLSRSLSHFLNPLELYKYSFADGVVFYRLSAPPYKIANPGTNKKLQRREFLTSEKLLLLTSLKYSPRSSEKSEKLIDHCRKVPGLRYNGRQI